MIKCLVLLVLLGVITLIISIKFNYPPDSNYDKLMNIGPYITESLYFFCEFVLKMEKEKIEKKAPDSDNDELKFKKRIKRGEQLKKVVFIVAILFFLYVNVNTFIEQIDRKLPPPIGISETDSVSNTITEITTLSTTTILPTTTSPPIQITSSAPKQKGYFNVTKNTRDWTWKGGFYSESIVLTDKFEVPYEGRYRFDFSWISNVENEYYIYIENAVGEAIKEAYSSSDGITCELNARETYTIFIKAHSFVSAFDFRITMHIPENY